ncbi:MAG: SAP domain-containing protein [Candidatus Poseidoniaceae archaeon]|nr:SAP domain-containing protein [Candidatus Poseidoniaceae archaeon]
MSDDLTSTLTAAKLKALCVLNDLATSGKKSELLQRLLDSGLERDELGLPSISEVAEDEVTFSLEDEDTLTPEIEPEESIQSKRKVKDEILEAEILDADLIDISEEIEKPKSTIKPVASKQSNIEKPTTLFEMIKKPQVAAAVLALIILGAGGWYYFNAQLEPFTADQLRYGDEMTYTISDGDFMATEGFLDLVLDQIETEDDICKLRLMFDGLGDVSITDGGTDQLVSQTSNDRIGAVGVRGGQGMSWLSVEAVSSYDFDSFTIQRHLQSSIPGSNGCSDFPASISGTADITSTKWTELRERESLGTKVDWNLNIEDSYEGTLMSYGVGGLFGDLEVISPGFSLLVQPVELQELLANDYIDDGATGSRLGWDWRVLGTDVLGSTDMWKIVATNKDVQDYCLGSASMTLWVEEGNPWATRQEVDVRISGSDSGQQDCSTTSKLLGDYILPEGELTVSHTFQKSSLKLGNKALEYGLSYDARPLANELSPDEDEMNEWGVNGIHMPDNSTMRTHNLETSMQCFDYFLSDAAGATAALDDSGYIWRAIDTNFGTTTQWNVSWIATDETAGWVKFNVTGAPSSENCYFDSKGAYDESIAHNREFIPEVIDISNLESRLSDSSRFSDLSETNGIFTSSGEYHPETRVGYLVVVPGSGINSILTNIGDATDGATTVDFSREWDSNGWDNRFNLVADATDGRIIGWNYVKNS